MIELFGKYNKDCKIMIDDVESEAISLIQAILDQEVSEGVPVRIMPDVHAGKGIVIGFSMPLTKMLSPSYVGVDIGCGMLSAKFTPKKSLDLKVIDDSIRMNVPMGFKIHESTVFKNIPYVDVQEIADKFTKEFNIKFGTTHVAPTYNEKWLVNKLKSIDMDASKFWFSIGSLGGGNHFIEIGVDGSGSNWVTVHTGSRNFGLKIADYWTNVATGKQMATTKEYTTRLDDIITNTPQKKDIPTRIAELKKEFGLGTNREFLKDDNLMGYLYDMIFAQQYAMWNRATIMDAIKNAMNIVRFDEVVSSIHNYIDFNDFIIRKGAISSYKGQKMIIPFNMRDGILLCEGKSNADWNFSAPHGAGRLMSRSKAKASVDLDDFKETMKDVYSTSVCKSTLDESPFAYKKSSVIENAIEPTAVILEKIKPILNIKDNSESMSWKERKMIAKKDKTRKGDRKAISKFKGK